MRKPTLFILFLIVFADLVGFGIVLPLLPLYSEQFGASGLAIGCIVASYNLMQFFFAPWLGKLSDRIGRRPIILISTAGSTISYAMFGYASGLEGTYGLMMLLLSRVFAGICGANLSVASAYVADITPPEKRSRGVGLVIGMGFGLGFIFGPLIGGLSDHFLGPQGPGWVAASICLINFVAACFILSESRAKDAKPAVKRAQWAQWAHTLGQPKLRLLVTLVFLATLCFACFETTLPLLMVDYMGFERKECYYFLAYSGFIATMVQGGAIGRLVHRFGEKPLIFASFFGLTLSFFMIPASSNVVWILISLAVYAIFSGINRAPLTGLISIVSPDNEQGSNLGVSQSASAVARIIGPPMATMFYGLHQPLPYWVCGVIALVAGLIAGAFLSKLLGQTQDGKGGSAAREQQASES
ncbi:MAG: MFS transporter [Verrucomicrobia bacterium]|nr:MFS transporter [Verrucomicrobiota bacterium]